MTPTHATQVTQITTISSKCCKLTLIHPEKWEKNWPPRMPLPQSHRTGSQWPWCSSAAWSEARIALAPASDSLIRLPTSTFCVSSLSPGKPSSGAQWPHLHLNDAWRLQNAFLLRRFQGPLGFCLSDPYGSPWSPLSPHQSAGSGLCRLALTTSSLQHGTTHGPSMHLCYL